AGDTSGCRRTDGVPAEKGRILMSINKITADDVDHFRISHNLQAGNAMDDYQRIATKSAIYPGQGTALGLAYVALKGCGEAGEFAEHVGKAMRDDKLMQGLRCHLDGSVTNSLMTLTDERHDKLVKE